MARTVSDQLIARLVEWSVHRVYGYPGDGINGVMGAAAARAGHLPNDLQELAAVEPPQGAAGGQVQRARVVGRAGGDEEVIR